MEDLVPQQVTKRPSFRKRVKEHNKPTNNDFEDVGSEADSVKKVDSKAAAVALEAVLPENELLPLL